MEKRKYKGGQTSIVHNYNNIYNQGNNQTINHELKFTKSYMFTSFINELIYSGSGYFAIQLPNNLKILSITNCALESKKLKSIEINLRLVLKEQSLIIYDLRNGFFSYRNAEKKEEYIINYGYTSLNLYHNADENYIFHSDQNVQLNVIIIPISSLVSLVGQELYEILHDLLIINTQSIYKLKYVPTKIYYAQKQFICGNLNIPAYEMQALVIDFILDICRHVVVISNKNNYNEIPQFNKINAIELTKIYQDLVQIHGRLPNLNDYCSVRGYSYMHVKEFYKTIYGRNFYSSVVAGRLNNSHEIIKSTLVPLKEISYQLGYSHVNHFNYAFKKYFGYTPGSLRKMYFN